MSDVVQKYWDLKFQDVGKNLEKNNFSVLYAASPEEAREKSLGHVRAHAPCRISWGGSLTFTQIGLYHALLKEKNLEILDTYDKSLTPEQSLERRRQALLADVFITGTNALTENGHLVNLDMIGNRVGALTFGPRHVLVLASRNKITRDPASAMERIKNYSAPVNSARLKKKTPCAETGVCRDCKSPDRICNTWTITEKSFPVGRVCVMLINADLGF